MLNTLNFVHMIFDKFGGKCGNVLEFRLTVMWKRFLDQLSVYVKISKWQEATILLQSRRRLTIKTNKV